MESLKNKVGNLINCVFRNEKGSCSVYRGTDDAVSKLMLLGPDAVPHIISALEKAEGAGLIHGKFSYLFRILDAVLKLAGPEHLGDIAKLVRFDSIYKSAERSCRYTILKIFEKIGDRSAMPHLIEFRKRMRSVRYKDRHFNDYDYYTGRREHEFYPASSYNRMDSEEIREAIDKILNKPMKCSSAVKELIQKLFEGDGVNQYKIADRIEELASREDVDYAVEELCRRVDPNANPSRENFGSAVFILVTAILPRALPRHAIGLCRVLASDFVSLEIDRSTRGRILGWVTERVRDHSVLPLLIEHRNKVKKVKFKAGDKWLFGADQRRARAAIEAVLLPPGVPYPKKHFSI
jgi:hypothetical protein